jgi:HEAT repeat protein
MLDNAFEALKKFDYGTDLAVLAPIEDAAIAAHGKPEAAKELETRLLAALNGDLSRDAQEYVCRKLATIGTAAAVPQLAILVVHKDVSHMARFALERIPAAEAAQALRDALPKVTGLTKVGIVSSIGARRDAGGFSVLAGLLKDGDAAVARSAALALGAIGSAEAAAALKQALNGATSSTPVVDALLSCAESLLAGNKVADASAIYTAFAQDGQPRLVRLAATRGLLACAGKQA